MEKKISFCGMDCLACPAYIASQLGNKKALKRIVTKWSNGILKLDRENFDCVGCTEDGQHYSWCDICPIRKCNMDKKIKNCAYCIHYPCEELSEPFERLPDTKKTLDDIRKNM
ncbi:MAG: DUF3795 domain-containing protein [Promethearchaeota archaeon]